MNNKKKIILENYVKIYRPILEKEKKKTMQEIIQTSSSHDSAA